jgi:hypothetical protein
MLWAGEGRTDTPSTQVEETGEQVTEHAGQDVDVELLIKVDPMSRTGSGDK